MTDNGYRKYRMTRRGARAVTLVAFASAILIGVEAAARAQEAGSQTQQMPVLDNRVAKGVTVAGAYVGGMSAAEAEEVLRAHAARPVMVAFQGDAWRFAPETLGARADVDAAVQAAIAAPARAELELGVEIDLNRLQRWTKRFANGFDEQRRDARIVLHGERPTVVDGRAGRKLPPDAATAAVVTALESGRRVVELPARILEPRVTKKEVGLAIVIKRASNKLVLYRPGGPKGMKVKRRFGVATGQASYPTPLGSFEIVRMQRNPWWIPPDSDWAKDAKPVPPGPGNPLGTRWMGLNSPGVGIHGTPDAASIGYSASHGCIRMLVPEAEWLFERVELGTPVYILDA
jgi:lipoprotein-anchoring transpeptidase ErfK/SrfK